MKRLFEIFNFDDFSAAFLFEKSGAYNCNSFTNRTIMEIIQMSKNSVKEDICASEKLLFKESQTIFADE